MRRKYGSLVVEANQNGRKKNIEECEGKTIMACKDVGKNRLEFLLNDGTKVEVGGDVDPYNGIYYKIESQNDEDKKLVDVKKKEGMGRKSVK